MGKLIVEQIVSADGYAEDEKGKIDFFENERSINDADEAQLRMLDSVGAIVFGRRTYELFEEFWSGMDPAEEPVAKPLNEIAKYVVSNSLTSAPWGSKGDSAEVILRLGIVPKLIGAGRSVTPRDLGQRMLALRSMQSYHDGFIVIEYEVAQKDSLAT